jgi:hypothetical protein
MQELYVEVTVLSRDYGAATLPFPDALLRLPRLRALSLQIPCAVGAAPSNLQSYDISAMICFI